VTYGDHIVTNAPCDKLQSQHKTISTCKKSFCRQKVNDMAIWDDKNFLQDARKIPARNYVKNFLAAVLLALQDIF
jgi:hypothetical protein